MKIKRFNNLWFMGLLLSAVILGAIYLLKIFMPQFVIEVAHIESIVRIGHYIDTHKWAWYVVSAIMAFANYYLICCACCKKRFLNTRELIIILATIGLLFIVKEFFPTQYTSLNISSVVLLPCIMKGDFKATSIVFVSTNFLQTITGEIRGIMSMVIDFNYATMMILTIDFYIVSVLFYFYFKYDKELNKNGTS
jgi:hypothetical protein